MAQTVFFDDPDISGVIVHARDWSVVGAAQPANSGSGAGTMAPAAATPPNIARKVELHIDMHVAPGVAVGTHTFRIRTPLGSTDLQTIAIGDTKEATEREPNDTPTDAQPLEWPVTVNGRMQERGDVDCYRIALSAGQRVVHDRRREPRLPHGLRSRAPRRHRYRRGTQLPWCLEYARFTD
jgi:hypothetical protein